MTDRSRPPRPPRGPRSAQRPKGLDGVDELSDEEVQRRVAVEGGVFPKPVIEPRAYARRPPPRQDRAGARDSLLLLGLVIVGLVAVTILLPKGPLTASSTNPPPQSLVAVASPSSSTAPIPTPSAVLITLPPTDTPSPAPETPSAEPSAPVVTPAPTPAPTLRPGSTPSPTPRPTKTPSTTPTPAPTKTPAPTPTAPPSTAKLAINVVLIKDDGGNASVSAWTVNVTSSGVATPASFNATGTVTNVTVTAGVAYSVGVTGGLPGYATSKSAGCSSATGGLPAPGSTQTCTIIRNDVKPRLTVVTNVDPGGGASPSDWTITVTGTDVVPDTFAGSASGQLVRLNANAAYSVGASNGPADHEIDVSDPGCTGLLSEGGAASCTVTITYVPPPTAATPASAPLTGVILLAAFLPRSRRWRTTPRS